MAVKYVWIYDLAGALVGMWITGSLVHDSNRDNILGMAVAERSNAVEANGEDPDELGFTAENRAAFTRRAYREYPNGTTEIGTNTFSGGAFLMLGGAPSPSEVEDSANTYVVRQAGGAFGIIQVKPLQDAPPVASGPPAVAGRRWWQFWK